MKLSIRKSIEGLIVFILLMVTVSCADRTIYYPPVPPVPPSGRVTYATCVFPEKSRYLSKDNIILGEVYLDKFVRSGLNAYKNSQAYDVFLKAALDQTVETYYFCRALEQKIVSGEEEIKYLKQKFELLSIAPNPSEFRDWEIEHPFPGGSRLIEISPSQIEINSQTPVSEMVIFNRGDVPIDISLDLPSFLYSPYKSIHVPAQEKMVISIISVRQSKESVAIPLGVHEGKIIPNGLAPIPFTILVGD